MCYLDLGVGYPEDATNSFFLNFGTNLPDFASSHPLTHTQFRSTLHMFASYPSSNSALEWVINATVQPLYPRQRDTVSIVQETEWVPASVWTSAEYLATTRIRSSDRPARSESLYWLEKQNLVMKLMNSPSVLIN